MKRVLIRCWEEIVCGPDSSTGDTIYIPSSEAHMGFRLIQCGECGEIYAISISTEMYSDTDLVAGLRCVSCSCQLAQHAYEYPKTYRKQDGKAGRIDLSFFDLNDERSIMQAFYSISSTDDVVAE